MEDSADQFSSDAANGIVEDPPSLIQIETVEAEETLYGSLQRLAAEILFPDPASDVASSSLFQRIKTSVNENASSIREGSRNTSRKILLWAKQGSPLRALLVISVGTITLLALTGFLVFMLFFLAATANAIIISLLLTVAAVGGFIALFFACVTVIYVAAVSVAFFVISTATISTIIAVVIATGWIGFLCTVWLAAKKSWDFTRHSLSMTGAALSAYSAARYAHKID